jgi:hypothetical protein
MHPAGSRSTSGDRCRAETPGSPTRRLAPEPAVAAACLPGPERAAAVNAATRAASKRALVAAFA